MAKNTYSGHKYKLSASDKSALDKVKDKASPQSAAGLLRDRKKELDRKIKGAGG